MKRTARLFHRHGWVLPLACFLVISILMNYPVVTHLGDSVPGLPMDNFDFVHEIFWWKYSLFQPGASPFVDPRIFYPYGYPMIAARHSTSVNTLLTVPLSLVTNEVVAYNGLVLFSFVFSALGAYLLAFYLTRSRLAGLVAGVVFAFCPYRTFALHCGLLNVLQTQWLPFLFLFVEKTIRDRRPKSGFCSGFFYALTMLSGLQYALMTLVVMVIYVLVRARPWRAYLADRRVWTCLLIFASTVLTVAGPVLYPSVLLHLTHTYGSLTIQASGISASPTDFLMPSVFHPLWSKYLIPYYVRNSHTSFVALGVVPLVLMLVALWRNRSRSVRVYGLLLASSILLALGPNLQVGGQTVYIPVPSLIERAFTGVMTFLSKHVALNPTRFYWTLWVKDAIYVPLPSMLLYLFVPFFHLMNYPVRFAVFAALAIAVLAGAGISRLFVRLCSQVQGVSRSWSRACLTLVVIGVILFEYLAVPPPFGMCKIRPQPTDEWLAKRPGDFAIMKYPLSRAFQGTSNYGVQVHGKNIVYGYGSFIPRTFRDQMDVLDRFPEPDCVDLLKEWGVRYVLLYSQSYGQAWAGLEQNVAANHTLRYVTTIQEEPIWTGDRLLKYLPEQSWLFVVDTVYVYEIVD
jgi:hypothetical protein